MTEMLDEIADEGDDFTELADAVVPRIDLVGKGANGIPFLIAKGQPGLLNANQVRALIPADPAPRDGVAWTDNKITVTGAPGAIAKMIHDAAQRQIAKKDFDTAERKHAAATGAAMPDGGYPIENTSQLSDAIHAVGRGSGSHDAIRRHIIARAKSLGAEHLIPDNWAADGSIKKESAMTDDVTKAGPDLDEPLEGAGDSSPMPGSPEWEAIDAATAGKWIGVLGRAKNAIGLLRDRELQEAVVGSDSDSADNAADLSDAESAIDCAIGILAPYAVGEQMEAGEEGDDLTLVGKAAAGIEAPTAVIEALAPIRKAGRVLSGANETKLRDAVALLQQVLATLPAPVSDSGQPVAKEADMVDDKTDETPAGDTLTTVEKAAQAVAVENMSLGIVQKAKGDPVVVVFNAEGKLIGVVDPADLMPVSDAGKGSGGSDDSGAADDSASADSADAGDTGDAAAAAPTTDAAAPAAPADGSATIPGTDTVQAPAQSGDDDVTKAAAADSTQQALELIRTALTPLAEKVDEASNLASVVKSLQDRVEYLAKLPDERRAPAMNGVGNFGTGNEGTTGDQFADLRKAVDEAPNDSARKVAMQHLAYAEIKSRFQR